MLSISFSFQDGNIINNNGDQATLAQYPRTTTTTTSTSRLGRIIRKRTTTATTLAGALATFYSSQFLHRRTSRQQPHQQQQHAMIITMMIMMCLHPRHPILPTIPARRPHSPIRLHFLPSPPQAVARVKETAIIPIITIRSWH